jgi:hypothetical protein
MDLRMFCHVKGIATINWKKNNTHTHTHTPTTKNNSTINNILFVLKRGKKDETVLPKEILNSMTISRTAAYNLTKKNICLWRNILTKQPV